MFSRLLHLAEAFATGVRSRPPESGHDRPDHDGFDPEHARECADRAERAIEHGKYGYARTLYENAAAADPAHFNALKGLDERIALHEATRAQARAQEDAEYSEAYQAKLVRWKLLVGVPLDIDEDQPCALDSFQPGEAARLKRIIRSTTITPRLAEDWEQFFAEIRSQYEAEGRRYPFSDDDQKVIRYRWSQTGALGNINMLDAGYTQPSYPTSRRLPRGVYLGGGFETSRRRH